MRVVDDDTLHNAGPDLAMPTSSTALTPCNQHNPGSFFHFRVGRQVTSPILPGFVR
jgi:hypothetical protein